MKVKKEKKDVNQVAKSVMDKFLRKADPGLPNKSTTQKQSAKKDKK
jgi:hypothetical protein